MDPTEENDKDFVVALALMIYHRLWRRRRSCLVKPWITRRLNFGPYNTLMEDLERAPKGDFVVFLKTEPAMSYTRGWPLDWPRKTPVFKKLRLHALSWLSHFVSWLPETAITARPSHLGWPTTPFPLLRKSVMQLLQNVTKNWRDYLILLMYGSKSTTLSGKGGICQMQLVT